MQCPREGFVDMIGETLLAAAIAIAAFLVLNFTRVRAAEKPALRSELSRLAHDWEHIKLEIADRDDQERQMGILAQQAKDIAQRHQNIPESAIWVGIITSEQASLANENGSPIKALGLAKHARDLLEEAEKIDPVTLDAAAPTSLGVLYNRVPGFPIGFGDKSKARHYLQEAVTNAPNGFDANYFFGEFLYEQHEYPEAINMFRRALTLPTLSDRPIWDRSQRSGIQEFLLKMHSTIRP
jgi:tetratricopeptide (TPR) repeat protein